MLDSLPGVQTPWIPSKAGATHQAKSVADGTGGELGWLWANPNTAIWCWRAHFWASSCSRGSMAKRRPRSSATGQRLQQGQTSCTTRTLAICPQQQGTPFQGVSRGQKPLQLRSQTEIRPYQSWRFAAHTDTL